MIEFGRSEAAFERCLRGAVALGCTLVADLGDRDMLRSSTLEALHRAGGWLRRHGGGLTVVVRQDRLVRLLGLTLLGASFTVVRGRTGAERRDARVNGTVELEVPGDRSFDPVARLVAGGVGSRAGLGVDVIDDLQLALEAVLNRPDARGPTRIALTTADDGLEVEIGPLVTHDAGRELERVLSTLVSDVEARASGLQTLIKLRLATAQPSLGRRCPA